jgi:transcriptional regulator with XRE-family HTH domain
LIFGMAEDWSLRIRSYRRRTGLTQEALAELFMVEPRTIRRWEAGHSQPPAKIRQRLTKTSVPAISRPEISVLREMVETSSQGITLLNDDLIVLAMSSRDRQWFTSNFGQVPLQASIEHFIPPTVRDLVEPHGGWRRAIDAGLSSMMADFQIPGLASFAGRMQWTVLRLGDGARIHTCVSKTLPSMSAPLPATLTFIDEVRSEE